MLERASAGGGSSALCGGFIYLGGGTRVQKLNGFDDTVEDMFKYLMAMTPNPDEEKIRLYCENSLEHFDWLERQCIFFNNGFYPDKHFEHSTAEFHKYHDWVQPLVEPPFAALDCSLGSAFYSGFSLGGLATNAKAQVLDASGKPIAGLYAAGACATNIAKDGMGYSSGTCVGESTFFGRQAGNDVVRR